MGSETFGKAKLGSARDYLFKMLRSIRGPGKAGATASPLACAAEDSVQPIAFNLQAHLGAEQRMAEIEAEKAIAISTLRQLEIKRI